MTNIWKNVSFALTAMLVGSLVTGVVLTLPNKFGIGRLVAQGNSNQLQTRPPLNQQNLSAALDLSSAFRNVADAMRPSVVSITTRSAPSRQNLPPGFEEFFGGRIPQGGC